MGGLTWPGAPSCRHWEENVCSWTLIWIWTWTWTSSCTSSSSCPCLWLLLWSCCGRRRWCPCCGEPPASSCWLAVSEGLKVLMGNRWSPAETRPANLLEPGPGSAFSCLTTCPPPDDGSLGPSPRQPAKHHASGSTHLLSAGVQLHPLGLGLARVGLSEGLEEERRLPLPLRLQLLLLGLLRRLSQLLPRRRRQPVLQLQLG